MIKKYTLETSERLRDFNGGALHVIAVTAINF